MMCGPNKREIVTGRGGKGVIIPCLLDTKEVEVSGGHQNLEILHEIPKDTSDETQFQ